MGVILGGQVRPGQRAHNALPVEKEYGWLTPWSFRCRCGTMVFREMGHVRRSERGGVTSKCSRNCTHREQPTEERATDV